MAKTESLLCLILLIALTLAQNTSTGTKKNRDQFRVVYEWNVLDYEWETEDARKAALNSSRYIPKNVIVSGIAYYDKKFYVTLPRMRNGVPATLATLPAISNNTSPNLVPFPSWELNAIGECQAFQFVQNVEVDKNGIMWVIDNGRIGTLTPNSDSKCPPTLVLIDLKDGKNAITRYTFPDTVVSPTASYLNDLVIDNTDGDYAYITDNSATDPGIVVFRRKDGKSWKVRDGVTMSAQQYASNFYVNGTVINLPVNVDGIALGPLFSAGNSTDRTVYYCPMSSFHLFAVNASILRDETRAAASGEMLRKGVRDLGVKASQTDGMKMDSEGTLYYGLISNSTIAVWDSSKDFKTSQQTIARDPNFIQWVDRFTFDDTGNLYVVINRLHNFVADKVSVDEVNYRILKSHTGTKSYVFSEASPGSGAAAAPGEPQPRSSASALRVTAATLPLLIALLMR